MDRTKRSDFHAELDEESRRTKPSACWRTLGCFVGISTLVLALGGVIAGILVTSNPQGVIEALVRGDMSLGLGPQQQSVENPAAFNPIAMLPTAQAMAGEGAQLLEIEMRFVRADGMMDLTATYNPAPSTTYTFMIEVPPPPDAPPIGVGSYAGGNFYQRMEVIAERPGQARRVTELSGGGRLEYIYVTQGLRLNPSDPRGDAPGTPIALPTCSLAALWEEAIRRDAPRDAVATISYDQTGYRFSIPGVVSLSFNADCTPMN